MLKVGAQDGLRVQVPARVGSEARSPVETAKLSIDQAKLDTDLGTVRESIVLK